VTPPDSPREISLVLDTTAVLAYAAGSMHVHEPLILAAEAETDAAVPLPCLLEAVRRDPGADVYGVTHNRLIQVVQPAWEDVELVRDWTLYYDGREDLAAAAVISYRHDYCPVLTAEPDAYLLAGKRPRWIIPIDGTW
jgi:hypothetical protein